MGFERVAQWSLFVILFSIISAKLMKNEATCYKSCPLTEDGCCENDEEGNCLRYGCLNCDCEAPSYQCEQRLVELEKRDVQNCVAGFHVPDCSFCSDEVFSGNADTGMSKRAQEPTFVANVTDSTLGYCPVGQTCLLDFEGLPSDYKIVEYFQGLWIQNPGSPPGYNGNTGYWGTAKGKNLPTNAPTPSGYYPRNYPHSGTQNIINDWGASQMTIQFPFTVDLVEAWFAVQGSPQNWAPGIVCSGYLSTYLIAQTAFVPLSQNVTRVDLYGAGLRGIDTFVVQSTSVPAVKGNYSYGWWGMDSFLFVRDNYFNGKK